MRVASQVAAWVWSPVGAIPTLGLVSMVSKVVKVVEVTVEYEIGVVSGGLGQPELELFGTETIDGEDEGGGYLGFGVWGDVAHNPFV